MQKQQPVGSYRHTLIKPGRPISSEKGRCGCRLLV
uniref:Uncharacterized protein n=1 Tax=Anguilla anguilla TaxID=7936 RepID=A0A0E9VS42_ANGAN